MNRISGIICVALGALTGAAWIAHGYILGVVADRPESDGAFQGAELPTLTLTSMFGVGASLVLVLLGVALLVQARDHVDA